MLQLCKQSYVGLWSIVVKFRFLESPISETSRDVLNQKVFPLDFLHCNFTPRGVLQIFTGMIEGFWGV